MAQPDNNATNFAGSVIRGAIEGAVAGFSAGVLLIFLNPPLEQLFDQAAGYMGFAAFLFVSAQVGVVLSIFTQLGFKPPPSPQPHHTTHRRRIDRR